MVANTTFIAYNTVVDITMRVIIQWKNVLLIILFYLAKENYIFDITILYKAILVSVAGGIGGVIGVNFK